MRAISPLALKQVRGAVTTMFGGLCHVDENTPHAPHKRIFDVLDRDLAPHLEAID